MSKRDYSTKLHTDLLMSSLNQGVHAYKEWQCQVLSVTVKVCILSVCMHLRGAVDTVTLLMMMNKVGELDH